MTKSELISTLAREADLSKKCAEEVVNCIFSTMTESLISGSRIEIRGFGSFSLKHYDARKGRNPKSGEQVDVKSKRAVQFKVGKNLRDKIECIKPSS
jgi:integration host factor subunit beta